MKRLLMDMDIPELARLLEGWGEPPFRAKQVGEWLLRGVKPQGMRNIPKTLRERLDTYAWGGVEIRQKAESVKDGTVKYLFELYDGELVEGVLMRYHHGNTLCLSTQVGCRMGCAFCASTLGGCVRDLSHGEMLAQVVAVERDIDEGFRPGQARAISNLVLMGSGEPLDNYDNTVAFLRRAASPEGLGISPRNISLSTCGLVPEIERLPQDAPHVTLCVSLHAHSDAVRDQLVPINKKYPIAMVLGAANRYAEATGRRVIIEYALIEGVNASEQDAAALAARLKGMLCHVNLIPLNPVPERDLQGVSRKHAVQFAQWLTEKGVSATLRREMGADIEGACGQLRRRMLEEGSACPSQRM